MPSVTIKLVSMLVIGLIVGAGGVYGTMLSQRSSGSLSTVTSTSTVTVTSGTQTTSQPSQSALSGVIPIGIAYELTGSISDYGVDMAHAAQLAISDMNTYLSDNNLCDSRAEGLVGHCCALVRGRGDCSEDIPPWRSNSRSI